MRRADEETVFQGGSLMMPGRALEDFGSMEEASRSSLKVREGFQEEEAPDS